MISRNKNVGKGLHGGKFGHCIAAQSSLPVFLIVKSFVLRRACGCARQMAALFQLDWRRSYSVALTICKNLGRSCGSSKS